MKEILVMALRPERLFLTVSQSGSFGRCGAGGAIARGRSAAGGPGGGGTVCDDGRGGGGGELFTEKPVKMSKYCGLLCEGLGPT